MNEKTIRCERVFEGRLLKIDVLEVELDSGVRARREIVRHPGAVVVAAELPDGRLVLVRQYRKAVEMELLEFCAGTLEPGEAPERCAARELKEETGFEAERLTALGVICLAPGYSQERLHVFHARLRPAAGDAAPEADEALSVVTMARAAFERMVAEGGIADAKTLAAWQLAGARKRGVGARESEG